MPLVNNTWLNYCQSLLFTELFDCEGIQLCKFQLCLFINFLKIGVYNIYTLQSVLWK